MNVTLSFICLRYEQVGNMPADTVFITNGITSEDFLKSATVLVGEFGSEE